MKATTAVPSTIEEYIAGFPEAVQRKLGQMRATIRKAAPKAEESIAYRIGLIAKLVKARVAENAARATTRKTKATKSPR